MTSESRHEQCHLCPADVGHPHNVTGTLKQPCGEVHAARTAAGAAAGGVAPPAPASSQLTLNSSIQRARAGTGRPQRALS